MILIKEIEQLPEEKQKLKKFMSHFTIPVQKEKELNSFGKSSTGEKTFLSLETDNSWKITRIRKGLDLLRPKINTIISKGDQAMSYKMRLGKLSALVLFILVLMNLFSISTIAIKQDAEYYPFFIFAMLSFLFFLHMETKITESDIKNAFKRIKN